MFKLVARNQNFWQHCLSCLSSLHNYFDDSIKLFSDLYLAKFLDIFFRYFNGIVLFMKLFRIYVIHVNNIFFMDEKKSMVGYLHFMSILSLNISRIRSY